MPTNEDILQTYVQTLGITTTSLESERASYSVIDPEGANSRGANCKHKNWSCVDENIDCMIFVVPLCAYDTANSGYPDYYSKVGHYYLHP